MTIDQFFKNYDLLYSLFFGPLGMGLSGQRSTALLTFLKMAVWYQKPVFASAQWIANESQCNEKTVDRLVAWLKAENLIEVKRTRRADGYWSVNEINFAPLLLLLRRLLGPVVSQRAKNTIIRREGSAISVKASFIFKQGLRSITWESFIPFRKLPTGRTSLLWRNQAVMDIIRG